MHPTETLPLGKTASRRQENKEASLQPDQQAAVPESMPIK
jgi:hypothetical protein